MPTSWKSEFLKYSKCIIIIYTKMFPKYLTQSYLQEGENTSHILIVGRVLPTCISGVSSTTHQHKPPRFLTTYLIFLLTKKLVFSHFQNHSKPGVLHTRFVLCITNLCISTAEHSTSTDLYHGVCFEVTTEHRF